MGKVFDKAKDQYGALMHDQARRTGVSAQRLDESLSKNVPPEVLALQVNMNELKNNPSDPMHFTPDQIVGIAMFSRANKRRSAYTQEQAGALERNQLEADAAPTAGDGLMA
jgi:hypothetical protein